MLSLLFQTCYYLHKRFSERNFERISACLFFCCCFTSKLTVKSQIRSHAVPGLLSTHTPFELENRPYGFIFFLSTIFCLLPLALPCSVAPIVTSLLNGWEWPFWGHWNGAMRSINMRREQTTPPLFLLFTHFITACLLFSSVIITLLVHHHFRDLLSLHRNNKCSYWYSTELPVANLSKKFFNNGIRL